MLDYYCNVFFNVVKYDFISEKECTVLAMYVGMYCHIMRMRYNYNN